MWVNHNWDLLTGVGCGLKVIERWLLRLRATYPGCWLLVMVALCNRADHCIFALWFLFFLAWSQRSEIGCLPYFHTWCGLSANLECMSESAAHGSLKIQDAKNRHFGTIGQLCRAVSLQLRHVSTIGKKNFLNTDTLPHVLIICCTSAY